MAKFLTAAAASNQLEKLIQSSNERLWLISPYLKISKRIKEYIEDRDLFKIDIRIIYGKTELQHDEINWLNKLKSTKTSFKQSLHAKCYMNEETCIITSMNLYEYSQRNNDEMGVFFTKKDDPELYADAYKEARLLIRTSDEIRLSSEIVTNQTNETGSKPSQRQCPICSADIVEKDKSFQCQKYHWNKEAMKSEGCPFILWKNNKAIDDIIDDDNLELLLSKKRIQSNSGKYILDINEKYFIKKIDNATISKDIANTKKACPKCDGVLTKKSGKYGDFYGCSNFPKCKHIAK